MKTLSLISFLLLPLSCVQRTLPALGATDLIAYIDGSGDLNLIQPDGKGRRKLASGEMLQPITFSEQRVRNGQDFYSWPVWSPDGSRLACFHIVAGERDNTDGLYIFDVRSSRVLHAYTEPGLQPIYAYWAPTGQHLAVLLGGQGGLSLALWPAGADRRPKTVARGAPFYFHWRADGQALLIHTGGDPEAREGHSVSVLDVESGTRHLVSRTPATFGPPSWSHDGQWLAYGDKPEADNQATLIIAPTDGSTPKPLSTVPTKIALQWSPTQPLLAVATSSFLGNPLLDELRLIEVPSGKMRTAIRDPFAAYFWSPNGERILYVKRKFGTALWTWAVVEVKDGKTYEVVDFVPSRPLLLVFQYFDQYALSHRLWSPDNTRFVFAGGAGAETDPAEALRNPVVYVVEATEHATPQPLSDGHIAFWSPQ